MIKLHQQQNGKKGWLVKRQYFLLALELADNFLSETDLDILIKDICIPLKNICIFYIFVSFSQFMMIKQWWSSQQWISGDTVKERNIPYQTGNDLEKLNLNKTMIILYISIILFAMINTCREPQCLTSWYIPPTSLFPHLSAANSPQ